MAGIPHGVRAIRLQLDARGFDHAARAVEPALRPGLGRRSAVETPPMALSGASRRKQIPAGRGAPQARQREAQATQQGARGRRGKDFPLDRALA